ncbi:MAG: hypothetical protein AAGD10_01000 [Myxococcota bacterium]
MGLGEWKLLRQAVDVDDYPFGLMGPYRVGHKVQATRHGERRLAIMEDDPRVVELEWLAQEEVGDREQAVLRSIDRSLGLEHRHLAPLLGAGLHEGILYLARPHRLGRSLAQVMREADGHAELAPGILYALAEVVSFLADEGPEPGSCSAGGFDAEDVGLGFDGVLWLRAGTQALREAEAPAEADRVSLLGLCEAVGAWAGWVGPTPEVGEPIQSWSLRLRKAHRQACGERRVLLGTHLRRHYASAIRIERARFGLSPLQ